MVQMMPVFVFCQSDQYDPSNGLFSGIFEVQLPSGRGHFLSVIVSGSEFFVLNTLVGMPR